MRRANNYGCITKLSGKRRRPYIVTKYDKKASLKPNKDGTYSEKRKILGYFATLKEAEMFLANYNTKDALPDDTEAFYNITFKEVYDIWAERHLHKLRENTQKWYNKTIKKLTPLHKMKVRELRLYHLQSFIDSLGMVDKGTFNQLKIVMNAVFEWALKNDIITKNYVQYLEADTKEVVSHKPLTHKEYEKLWRSSEDIAKLILIYCHTGVRPSEFIELKKENVYDNYFKIVNSKTKSGIRTVPIADKIKPFFNDFIGKYDYQTYLSEFKEILPNHTPHDTRATFVSFATEKGNDKVLIQKIVGHKAGDVTTDVYTTISLEPLLKVVNSI